MTRPDTVNTVTQPQHTHPPHPRLWAAIGLGLTSIAASILLIATDGITQSAHWAHHDGISAAPLLLIAGAITAVTVAHPPPRRQTLLRLVAVLAFTAWGLAQLFPASAAAGYLNDAAILLFVTDAAYALASDARTPQAHRHPQPSRPSPRSTPQSPHTGSTPP